MSLEILDLSWNLVIWVLMSFAIGITSVTLYIKLKAFLKSSHQTDNSVVEAVVSEYTSKLEEFVKIIGELKVRIDTVELRMLQSPTSQTKNINHQCQFRWYLQNPNYKNTYRQPSRRHLLPQPGIPPLCITTRQITY